MTKFISLDVRPILTRGGDPFSAVRKTVDRLKTGEGLSVVAPFLPSPLIEKLGSEGFQSRVERRVDGTWVTHFWRDE